MVRTLLIAFVAILVTSTFCKADPRRDGETVVGAIWHWVITDADGKTRNGDFRVKDGDIYVGDDKIGSTRGIDSDEVTMTFGGYEPLNGKAKLRKVLSKPASFKGTLNRKDGTKWQMRVTVRNR